MLKLITPFRVLFNLDSSKIAAQPKLFTEFLKKIRKTLDDPESDLAKKVHPALEIEVNLSQQARDNESDSARDHSRSYLLPHILTLRFRSDYHNEMEKIYLRAATEADSAIEKYSTIFRPILESLTVRINDNTVATMSLDLQTDDPATLTADKADLKNINDWAALLVRHMLRELYPLMIFPLLKGLNAFSNQTKDHFVYDVSEYKIFFVLVGDPKNPYPDLNKRFIPMKTNITLCVDKDYAYNHWTKNVIDGDRCVRLKEAEIYIHDENNLIIMPPHMDTKDLDILWEIITSASYYYIAMNVINVNLIRYIGITSDKHSTKALRIIARDTENIINSVTILKVRYNDLAFELNGAARKIFLAIQKEWDFKNITDNMQNKLELCRTNIKNLSIETHRRNQGRIEAVLTGVAGISVMSIFIELGCYATQMPAENRKMVGDIPGFMDLGFMLSGNALSWIGIAIAVSVMVFTFKHRSG